MREPNAGPRGSPLRRAGGGGGDAVLDACVRACVSMLGESMPCDYSQLACTLGLGCQTDGQSNARPVSRFPDAHLRPRFCIRGSNRHGAHMSFVTHSPRCQGRALIARVPAAGTGEDPRIRVKRLRGSVTGTGRKTGQCCTPYVLVQIGTAKTQQRETGMGMGR